MSRKKVKWKPNDVFVIPLENGSFNVGHILDQRMVNAVRVAIYNEVLEDTDNVDLTEFIKKEDLISLLEVTRELLDSGVWKIIGEKDNQIPFDKFPNEQFRANQWINSMTYGAGIVRKFINAYHALLPWDDWYNPNYLDKLLVDPSKKPSKLLFKTVQ